MFGNGRNIWSTCVPTEKNHNPLRITWTVRGPGHKSFFLSFSLNISPVTIVVIPKKIMYKLRASENGAMRRISVHKKEEVTRR
jgi:hypothetical protein